MASNTAETDENQQQALVELLGEDNYRAYFEPEHIPSGIHYQTDLECESELVPAANSTSGGGAGNNWDMDSIFVEALTQSESSHIGRMYKAKTAVKTRFATPKSQEDVEQARKARITKKTQADTRYCAEIWKTWSKYRNSVVNSEQVN